MEANSICDSVLLFIKNSGLNFKIIETAFSANITIKKTLIKDKNGEVKSRCMTQTPRYDSNINFKNTITNPKQAPNFQPKNTSLDISSKPLIQTSLPIKNTSSTLPGTGPPWPCTTAMRLSQPSNTLPRNSTNQSMFSRSNMNTISTLPMNPVTNLPLPLSKQQLSKNLSTDKALDISTKLIKISSELSLEEKTNMNLSKIPFQKTSHTSQQGPRYTPPGSKAAPTPTGSPESKAPPFPPNTKTQPGFPSKPPSSLQADATSESISMLSFNRSSNPSFKTSTWEPFPFQQHNVPRDDHESYREESVEEFMERMRMRRMNLKNERMMEEIN